MAYNTDLIFHLVVKLTNKDLQTLASSSTLWTKIINKRVWEDRFLRIYGVKLPFGNDYEVGSIRLLKSNTDILAIINHYNELAIKLIKLNRDFNIYTVTAIERQNLEILNFLIFSGVEINNRLIKYAVEMNYDRVVMLLANNQARLDYALSIATIEDLSGIIILLIEKGANIHIKNDTCLRRAVIVSDLALVSFLLAKGADIHAQNDEALLNAIYVKDNLMIEFLLTKGADPNCQMSEPIKIAITEDNIKLIELLLKFGALITPSLISLAKQTSISITDFLLCRLYI